MIEIRNANAEDSDQIWEIIREVISKGDTYTFDPNSSKEMMLNYWYGPDRYTYVATDKGKIVGTFRLETINLAWVRTLQMEHTWCLKLHLAKALAKRWANFH